MFLIGISIATLVYDRLPSIDMKQIMAANVLLRGGIILMIVALTLISYSNIKNMLNGFLN